MKKSLLIYVMAFMTQMGCYDNGSKKEECGATTCFTEANNWKMAVSTDGRLGYDQFDLDNNADDHGGFLNIGSISREILIGGGIVIGATKSGDASVSMAAYTSEFSQGRILNSTPASIDNLNFSDDSLAKVFIINQTHSGFSWDNWPDWAGAPTVDGNPQLISSEDSWVVFHDADSVAHRDIDANPVLGIEVKQSTYAFTGTTVDNVLLVRWRVTNKSNIDYPDMYVGLWIDPDMGDVNDDLLASDTTRNMLVVYNGQDWPSKNTAVGWMSLYASGEGSSVKPAAMIKYLKNIDEARADNGQFNLLKGLNGDGSARTNVASNHPTYDYPGDPVTGTGILDTTGLDIRVLLSVGPVSLNAGQTKEFVFAVLASPGSDRLDAIINLRTTADGLRQLFISSIQSQLDL